MGVRIRHARIEQLLGANMRILAAHQQAAVVNGGGYRPWLTQIIKTRWGHEIKWDVDEQAPPIMAFISRGDWVASCDLDTVPPCGGSMVVTHDDPVWFCDECCNYSTQQKVRVIEFPPTNQRLIIEELLTARPHPGLRNYRPQDGDTVAVLRAENVQQPWIKQTEV